jgi:hypothetical protein
MKIFCCHPPQRRSTAERTVQKAAASLKILLDSIDRLSNIIATRQQAEWHAKFSIGFRNSCLQTVIKGSQKPLLNW